ncbi:DNA replication/repair protein RecF [Ligilactobacillus apodemi]|uniref:DNA replication and repair protein RecF n=1 Tax=Ligilactobacillus apodemi DSM 16634 = JCM 16172 TaxID=1423724 RepID=A0A0R1U259_9LACO|nr:DNA replication/repair protein RecF [Ligilactobacillus apodemi]KRL87425.1 recombination protein F [Ligilactobacillus apodemi DSM 16634 = JCM 16172]MBD5068585.1 DNA replication/repair protein RecF [Lactobacillus sp.]
MYLEELELKNFRNYRTIKVEFSPQINVLIGKNAQGKTNLLEAIYVLAMARSHRTNNDRELICFKQKDAFLAGRVTRKLGSLPLEILLNRRGKKAKVNHLEQARLSQYIGHLNVILFAPEDLLLVKGSPTVRRRFIDMEFGQIDPRYLYNLTQYRAILKQRNNYLKQLQQKKANDLMYLEVLSEQLATFGGAIIVKRLEFLAELERYAKEIHAQITQGNENLSFKYESSLKEDLKSTENEIIADLKKGFANLQPKEIFQGTTLLGPHRDDVVFEIDQKNVQIYGSQGQQRTTALSVKLAEIELMKSQTGEYPILLLDDVLSELDGTRQTHLLKAIQGKVQTFLTTPGLSEITQKLIKEPKIFHIEAGTISENSTQNENHIAWDSAKNDQVITFYPKTEK